jgi:phenylacetate-CoA ligase
MHPDGLVLPAPMVSHDVEAQLLTTFRVVAERRPWYRTLLDEAGIDPAAIRTATAFARCPTLTKQNTFERFGIRALAAGTPIDALASVLTSSGHGGRFSFGLTTRAMDTVAADAIDGALDEAFEVRSRPTLALNCLPMGVTFGSRCMTVATTSVREDMATALVEAFGDDFAQILVVADPLFLKRLTDHARSRGLDWRRHRVQVVVGEEVFGERFRTYMTGCFGLSPDRPDGTWLMSSMGVGELGLHLLYETRATVGLRRALTANAGLARDLLGPDRATSPAPMCFTYEPRRIFVEIDEPGRDGFGRLLVSMLDPGLPVPLLRYATGDEARLVEGEDVRRVLARHGVTIAEPCPESLVLLRGRTREALPNGSHVLAYKDAVYAAPDTAERLTGAVRLTSDAAGLTMHVQLVPGSTEPAGIVASLREALPAAAQPTRIEVWPYAMFPFGMTLDYERKFVSYVP